MPKGIEAENLTDSIELIRSKQVSDMTSTELAFIYKNTTPTREEVMELKARIEEKKRLKDVAIMASAKPSTKREGAHSGSYADKRAEERVEQAEGELPSSLTNGDAQHPEQEPIPFREKVADLDPFSAYDDEESASRKHTKASSHKASQAISIETDPVPEYNMAQKLGSCIKNALHEPIFVVSLVVLLFLVFFLRPFLVPSGSMQPTLQIGDRIFSIAQYFPNGQTYSRGDIACFTAPDGTVYVKRVIGIGGDHIQISGEKVYVNGEESPYQGTGGVATSMDVQLADDEYWMMGDNRGNSADSRYIGPIKAEKMISKVFAIYLPLDRMRLVE